MEGEKVYPSKVVCIGRNYVDHIEELDNEIPTEPVIFIKPNSAISSGIHFDPSDSIHYEGELTFLIRSGQLTGVGIGLDLTKRKVQTRLKSMGLPWERAKSFDKSAVFSDFVKIGEGIPDLSLELFINGQLVQLASYDLMLNKPDEILKDASRFLTFEDGDLLMCGTPKGVGEIKDGDKFYGKVMQNENILVEHKWSVEK